MNRDDAKAVIHLHTTAGIAVGASERGLRNLSTYSMILDPVSYHDWEGVVLGPDERERLAGDMGASAAMLLRNHGSLTVGESMGVAFLRMYFLQRACEVQISAETLGDELIEQPFEMSRRVQSQVAPNFSTTTRMNWDALLRKLDRIDTSYRD
jgi:ribulose-5-phosphate 4-epimerase/fuculose-1-phosphate aldolase